MTTRSDPKNLRSDLEAICNYEDPGQLWDSFLRVAMARSEADKGLLLLDYHGAPFSAAEAESNLRQVSVRIDRDGSAFDLALPDALLQRVHQEQRTIVVGSTAKLNSLLADKVPTERRPKAVLCMPIGSPSQPRGLLYLENHTAARAFTPDRVALLELLGALTNSMAARESDTGKRAEELASERKLLSTLIEHLPDYIYVKDRNGRFIADNVAIAERIVVVPDGASASVESSLAIDEQAVVHYGKPVLDREESSINPATGQRCWNTNTKVPLRDEAGNIIGLIGITRDITARKQAEAALRESERRFRNLTELSSDWYWEQDLDSRFVYLSKATSTNPHAIFRNAQGKALWELPDTTPLTGTWEDLQTAIMARRAFRDFEFSWTDKVLGVRYTSVAGMPIYDQEGVFRGYRGTGRDITERKLMEERIRYLATHDGLTGLPNRDMFSEILNRKLRTAQRYERGFAVLFIDLDRFKIINDTLGHEAGDTLLREMATRLTQCLRASDVLARLGGDEFVVFLQEVADGKQVAVAANKILSTVQRPVAIQEQQCLVTASIGISLYPHDGNDEQSLMKNADIAMYHAKEEGRNNFQFYSKDFKVQPLDRPALEDDVPFSGSGSQG